ncbi:MAG: helix-turn-helix transcriptional regulator [Bacillota bacterium]
MQTTTNINIWNGKKYIRKLITNSKRMSNLAAAAAALEEKNQMSTGVNAPPVNSTQNKQSIYKNNMDEIQASIKKERNQQGLTQRQLAKKAGMSQGTITRAECHGWVSIWTMLRIINALGKKLILN